MKAFFEKVAPNTGSAFKWNRFERAAFNSPYHYHPEIEITYIHSGYGTRFTGQRVDRFSAGDLAVFGEDLPHLYMTDRNCTEKSTSTVIQFRLDCLGNDFFRSTDLLPLNTFFDRARSGIHYSQETTSTALPLIEAIGSSKGIERIVKLLELLNLLERSSDYELLNPIGFKPNINKQFEKRINQACRYIQQHFDSQITLESIAKEVNLSPEAFSRFFKKATNLTFKHFLTQIKVGHACQLLIDTDLPVIEICFRSGFNNLSNFNRRFKEIQNCSPRAFRKNCERRQKQGSVSNL